MGRTITNTLNRTKTNKPNLDKLRRKSKSLTRLKLKISLFLEKWPIILFTTIITIYALFADDLRQLTGSTEIDPTFYIFILICFFIFVIEILLSSFAVKGYFLGFYFWLDFISTISLLLDVGWISELIFSSGSSSTNMALSGAAIARAARASKIGSRAGRIVRILRLIRLIRIVKLYKASEQMQINEKKKKLSSRRVESMHDSGPPIFKDRKTFMKKKRSSEMKAQLENKVSLRIEGEIDGRVRRLSKLHRERVSLIEMFNVNGLKSKAEFKEASQINDLIEGKNKVDDLDSFDEEANNYILEKNMLEKETNVGKKLSDLTTKRVVIIVLLITISIPVLSAGTYFKDYSNYKFGLEEMRILYDDQKEISEHFDYLWNYFIEINKGEQPELISLALSLYDEENPKIIKQYGNFENTKNYRTNELDIQVDPPELVVGEIYMIAYFDNKYKTDLSAVLSILRTLFVCVILAGAAMIFSKDATDLVLTPIEKMLQTINNITDNPLKARNIEEEEAFFWEKIVKDNKKVAKEREEMENYETSLLEKIIKKIGGLLAIGFGQAGSELIVKNMQKNGGVDPMIPGNKIMAIFGFCDIRNFTDATEILQADVMVFVNEIAEIVHSLVDKFGGAANKNIGDAFLLVWKFDEEDYDNEGGILILRDSIKTQCLADLSILSFVKIMAQIHSNYEMIKYNENEKLNNRIPGFKVKMGFGLNMGWAIEGAIGSAYKIDASYLSPNVNLASRLEAATKQFKTPLLISDKLYKICSKPLKEELRMIDVVTVKGSDDPISLYTYDVDITKLSIIKKQKEKYSGLEKKRQTFIERNRRREFQKMIFAGKIVSIDLFKKSTEIMIMRRKFSKEFFDLWRRGIHFYLDGEWEKAKSSMIETRDYFNNSQDGPSITLLDYMERRGFKAPEDWNGIRKLTEK